MITITIEYPTIQETRLPNGFVILDHTTATTVIQAHDVKYDLCHHRGFLASEFSITGHLAGAPQHFVT